MKLFKSNEWQRVRGIRGMVIALGVIALIPSLYAVIFLSSLWDTYGHVSHLPVAVVNQDQTTTVNGKTENLGQDLTTSLVNGQDLKFTQVSEKTAKSGLKSGKYYMTVTIPADFTKSSGTLLGKTPKTPTIDIQQNGGRSFFAQKITDSAAEKLKNKVSQSLQRVYLQNLLKGTKTSQDGFSKAATGVNQLGAALGKIKNGASQLQAGTTTLQTGSATLSNGLAQYTGAVGKLTTGSATLVTGNNQLATSLQKIGTGINQGQTANAANISQLNVGFDKVNQGLQQLSQLQVAIDHSQLDSDVTAVNSGLSNVDQNVNAVLADPTVQDKVKTDPAFAQQVNDLRSNLTATEKSSQDLKTSSAALTTAVTQQITGLKTQLTTLTTQATTLNNGAKAAIQQLNASLSQLANVLTTQAAPGATNLAQGATTLENSLGQVNGQSQTLNGGATALSAGASQLVAAENQVTTALQTAQSGSEQLAQSLANGAVKLSVVHTDKKNVQALTSPVKNKSTSLSNIANNGTGMAPYMMSVGLFVGMISFSTAFDFITLGKKPKSGLHWWAEKQTVTATVWVAQAVIMTGLLVLVDQMAPKHILMTFVVALVTAFAFNQFVTMVIVALGKRGSALLLVFMVLQLSASAGTYPIELSNHFFQAIHPFMPMTYSVDALRQVISIGGSATTDLLVLLVLGLVSMVLTWLMYHRKLENDTVLFPNSAKE
ncbi:YhgE/Pip family protein [Fructobacillus ficulneus]|nr:YhgE/Pip domain-containing protein [Fructobacillus ficulneus]